MSSVRTLDVVSFNEWMMEDPLFIHHWQEAIGRWVRLPWFEKVYGPGAAQLKRYWLGGGRDYEVCIRSILNMEVMLYTDDPSFDLWYTALDQVVRCVSVWSPSDLGECG